MIQFNMAWKFGFPLRFVGKTPVVNERLKISLS